MTWTQSVGHCWHVVYWREVFSEKWVKRCLLNDKCVVVVTSRGTHTNTTVLWPFFLDFLVQEKINRGRHTDCPAGRHSIRTNQCPPLQSPIFYGLDALPVAQPAVSKHWRQLAHLDKAEDARILLNGVTCAVTIPQTSRGTWLHMRNLVLSPFDFNILPPLKSRIVLLPTLRCL